MKVLCIYRGRRRSEISDRKNYLPCWARQTLTKSTSKEYPPDYIRVVYVTGEGNKNRDSCRQTKYICIQRVSVISRRKNMHFGEELCAVNGNNVLKARNATRRKQRVVIGDHSLVKPGEYM